MTRKVLEQSDENPLRATCRSSRVSDFEARGLRLDPKRWHSAVSLSEAHLLPIILIIKIPRKQLAPL